MNNLYCSCPKSNINYMRRLRRYLFNIGLNLNLLIKFLNSKYNFCKFFFACQLSFQPDFELRPGSCKMAVRYQPKMKEGLKNLGLYQMVHVHHCLIDRGLIAALVERWRPETNSFHLPVGECTVTLEDVSCLWGLSVTGKIFFVANLYFCY